MDARAQLQVVAWETTRRCPLRCRHCRGAACDQNYDGELTTVEGMRLIDALAIYTRPMLILTGGEPMARDDIYALAQYAVHRGLRTVMAPCGPMLDEPSARRLLAAGIRHISLSLDGHDAQAHDAFRGVPGVFDSIVRATQAARATGLEFQINTTVCSLNAQHLPALLNVVMALGAVAWDLFFLVPTGRGASLKDLSIPAEQYEEVLKWVVDTAPHVSIRMRTTCAPHYARVARVHGRSVPAGHGGGGCMAGRGFLFISHRGRVQPCGFLDLNCGDLRVGNFDVRHIYEQAAVFQSLRNPDLLHGKCGRCAFRHVCGGCRARAHEMTGDFLDAEPFCVYEPGLVESAT